MEKKDGAVKYIIIDTNIFVQDFWTQSSEFKMLFSNISSFDFKIILPQVVYDEVLSQYGKKYREYSSKIESPMNSLNKLTQKDFNLSESYNFSDAIKRYEKHLLDIILKYNMILVDYPETSHKKIAKRSMARIKPFKSNGEGYCDTLIWENILMILQDSGCSHLHFISNNPKDFFENEKIASILLDDLTKLKIDTNIISAHLSLQSFVKDEILVHKEQLDITKTIITKDVEKYFGSSMEQWIEDNLFDAIDPREIGKTIIDFPIHTCKFEMSEILTPSNIDIIETRLIKEEDRYVVLSFDIEIGIHICAYNEDFHIYKKLEALFTKYDSILPYTDYDCITVYVLSKIKASTYIENNDYTNASFTVLSNEGIAAPMKY